MSVGYCRVMESRSGEGNEVARWFVDDLVKEFLGRRCE